MAKEIYNKNAREAHLMAEAYSQVNEGHAGPVPDWKKQAGLEKAFKDFDDEQRDQDPHRHSDITDGHEREQRDQDPHRHEDAEDQVFGLVDASGNIVSLYTPNSAPGKAFVSAVQLCPIITSALCVVETSLGATSK